VELNVQELTVIPDPKLQVAPLKKLDPAIVADRLVFWAPEFGVTELTVGGGGGGAWFTVKPLLRLLV
jgi:hypothetical protein